MLHKSIGKLRYGYSNLVLDIDNEIVRYYRALLPKFIRLNTQMYDAHISVVRKETPPNMHLWKKYEGEEIEFFYTHQVRHGEVYYWVDAFSKRLEEIRVELGLEISSPYIQPPSGFVHCFHATIGNMKVLQQVTKKDGPIV